MTMTIYVWTVMGSFSGKMETAAAATDKCCRQANNCSNHAPPLAVQGKRLSLKLKPNNDNRNSARSVLTKDDDRANVGGCAGFDIFLSTQCIIICLFLYFLITICLLLIVLV